MQGFNLDTHLRDKFQQLITEHGITTVIETGTYHGESTVEFAKMCDKVHTVESNQDYQAIALEKFRDHGNIYPWLEQSPAFLEKALPAFEDEKLLIFLDAHWGGTPLIDELKAIAKSGLKPFIAIHDFKVPDKDFGFDSYNGQDYTWEWIEPYIRAIYGNNFKHYYNEEATGSRRGCVFIEPILVHFTQTFPENPLKVYSQTGEEGILLHIFEHIGTTNKFLVDFGAGDGYSLSNSQLLLEQGWTGLRMDGNGTGDVNVEFITAENILALFKKYQVPLTFDLLSIDIDGNDYWVLKEILKEYKPIVIVAEFNGCLPEGVSQTIAYNPTHVHQGDDYYGASFEAFKRLCVDYVVVHNQRNLNMFLVHKDVVGDVTVIVAHTQTKYHPHNPNGEWVVNPELQA